MAENADPRKVWGPPPRPEWVKRLNEEGECMDIRGVVPLDPGSMIDAAIRSVGLSDFGVEDWREPFDVLCKSFDEDADLNLMGRIKHHLKDRHKGLWDRFSVYITQRNEHVKQLESLLLRIASPVGNRVKGNFGGSANLYRSLNRTMTASDADKRASLLGGHAARQRRRRKTADARGTIALVGIVEKRLPLMGKYKGKTYRATLRRDGYISYAGNLYDSPSAAAMRIVKRAANGWHFWQYKESARKWKQLSELRR